MPLDIHRSTRIDHDQSHDRAKRLFTFLKELSELRTKTIRTVDQYDQVLWLADLPREPEIDCAAWYQEQEEVRDEVWLAVQKPRLAQPPQPPADLQPWLYPTQMSDSSVEMPELRKEIVVSVGSDNEHTVSRYIIDYPKIKPLWEQYVRTKWLPWAESDRRVQSIQRIYTDLFAIYQRQQRLGELYEVVLGLGLLTWNSSDGHNIRRHLITAQISLQFDSVRGLITIGPAGEGAKPALEQDMIEARHRPDPDELKSLEAQLSEIGDNIWDTIRVDAVLSSWVHAVSPKGVYTSTLNPSDSTPDNPHIELAPAGPPLL